MAKRPKLARALSTLAALTALGLGASGCPEAAEDTICERGGDDCSANASCYAGLEDTYVCICNAGYEGDGKTCTPGEGAVCDPDPCLNGGTCSDATGEAVCTCPAGFEGPTCADVSVDPCDPDPCLNGGSCLDQDGSAVCDCPAGFTGDTCATVIDGCDPDPCLNGGTCDDSNGATTCDCPAGYTGSTCGINVDDCADVTCQNGGTCVDQVDAYLCVCPAGYTGDNCDIVADGCDPDPCFNGGVCAKVGDTGFTCACPDGFEGSTCAINVDDCASAPCLNGGTCYDLVGGFACACAPGFAGDTCDTDMDDCADNPCLNGGTCTDAVNGFTCDCAPGYGGDTCGVSVDDCAADPCQNGGTCFDQVDGFTCVCALGYSGDTCDTDIDDCADNPCLNGGTCTDAVNGFTCECALGFGGDTCAENVDDCASAPDCGNGQCIDGVDTYTCDCDGGWTGPTCQIDVNECAIDAPCGPGAGCFNTPGGYECELPVFVDAAADPAVADGLSWETAYSHPYFALLTGARVLWVKAGTYVPSPAAGSGLELPPGARAYGGFDPALAGNEGDVASRDLENNVSEIDGSGRLHAVTMGAKSLLDGFTVLGGNAHSGPPHDIGGGIFVFTANDVTVANTRVTANQGRSGAGIGCYGSSGLNLINVVVDVNVADIGGGGISATACTTTANNLTVSGNTVLYSEVGGGGILLSEGTFSLTGGLIDGNTVATFDAGARGGGIAATSTGVSMLDVSITNNSVQGADLDSSGDGDGWGGGVYYDGEDSQPWTNIVLTGNTAAGGAGEPNYDSGTEPDGITCVDNRGGPGGAGLGGGLYAANGVLTLVGGQVLNNLALGGAGGAGGPASPFDGCSEGAQGPQGISDGGGGYYAADNAIVSAVEGDDALGNTPNLWGPCPFGFDGYLCEDNIDDCVGNPCVYGACSDLIGAFECLCEPGWQGELCDEDIDIDECIGVVCEGGDEICVDGVGEGVCTPVVMVAPGAADGGDGLSWETAYNSIQVAVDAGHTAVWVKEGTFTSTGETLLDMPERTVIMGGFQAALTGREGDPAARVERTVLDGAGLASPVVTMQERGSTLDGFVVQGGTGLRGGGVRVIGANRVTLSNVGIQLNNATGINAEGGGLYCEGAVDLRIIGGTLNNNTVGGPKNTWGGGASFVSCTGLLDGWAVFQNTATADETPRGGGIYILGGALDMTGGNISGNQALGKSASGVAQVGGGAFGGGVFVNSTSPMSWDGVTIDSNFVRGGDGSQGATAGPNWFCSSSPGGFNWCSAPGRSSGIFGNGVNAPCNSSGAGGSGGGSQGGGVYTTPGSVVVMSDLQVVLNTSLGGNGGAPGTVRVNTYNCHCSGSPGSLGQGCINAGSVTCSGTTVTCSSGPVGATGPSNGGGIYTSVAALTLDAVNFYQGGSGNTPNNIAPCPLGFTGPDCTEDIDECAAAPCLNGGTCTQGVGTFTCECPAGWVGDTCADYDCSAITCDDGDPCTVDACTAQEGCVYGAPFVCDDGLACSIDTCLDQVPVCPGDSQLVDGRCYDAKTTPGMNWVTLNTMCEETGGHLLTITSAEEATTVTGLVDATCPGMQVPLGLTDVAEEGTFVWTSGEPLVYTNWAGGEPNNYAGNEDVAARYPTGLWNDAPESQAFTCVVCEYPVGAATGNCSHDTTSCQ